MHCFTHFFVLFLHFFVHSFIFKHFLLNFCMHFLHFFDPSFCEQAFSHLHGSVPTLPSPSGWTTEVSHFLVHPGFFFASIMGLVARNSRETRSTASFMLVLSRCLLTGRGATHWSANKERVRSTASVASVLSSCRSCSEVRYGEREHARVTSHVTKKRMTLCGVCRGTGSDVPGGLWSTTKVPAGVVKRKREYVGLQVADTGCRAEGAGGAKREREREREREIVPTPYLLI